MSYRLIDANAIAAIATLRPEVNYMSYIYAQPCIYADLPSGLDGGHYDMRKSSELQRENAELRELLVDSLLTPETYCKKYGLEENFLVFVIHWGDRARALGIEV